MSAVAVQVTVPHYAEALTYWDELTMQCRRHVEAINAVIETNNLPEPYGVTWRTGRFNVSMGRDFYPSTEISLYLTFEPWGPKISASVRGYQEEDVRFYPEEFDFAVGSDEYGHPIGISGEGRSLSPHELAKYVAQNFRRCYPGISLPAPENPL